jgi:hypothetical protein
MTRPTIALVTGFTRNDELCRRSLAPLRELKEEGLLNRIINVTWDSPSLDAFVAPVAAMPDIELIRLPQPEVSGGIYRKGCTLQLRNLEAALAQVPEKDALIFKTRPDFVIDTDFLAGKVMNFDKLCAPSLLPFSFGVDMPDSPFEKKIWLPWADSNQPFFYEDGAFMGLKCDVAKLADRRAESYLSDLDNHTYSWLAHIVRFITPFLDDYPMFERYLRDFGCFPKIMDFRVNMLKVVNDDAFFWHLLIAHAWILATSFHIDCGEEGQMGLFTNLYNEKADWSKFETLRPSPPYNAVSNWREGQHPGGVVPGVSRVFGRLMDDNWQHALFTQPELRDLAPDAIRGVLHNISLYSQGLLTEVEDGYYGTLRQLCREHGFPAHSG